MTAPLTDQEARILRPLPHTSASLVPALLVERRRMYEARLAQVQAAPIRNSTRTNEAHYSGAELSTPAVRPGADDHLRLPSLRSDGRYFQDGRVEQIGHTFDSKK
jgi:hypothetical protein